MLLFITHRRLKPGSYDDFRTAWQPEVLPEGVNETAYHARNPKDPDEVISFGLFDGSMEDLPAMREKFGGRDAEDRRQARMAPFVEWTGLDGIFEVVEEMSVGE
jgi:hypothetical protein